MVNLTKHHKKQLRLDFFSWRLLTLLEALGRKGIYVSFCPNPHV